MQHYLKITDADGNTTSEFHDDAELPTWLSRQERAELELTGRVRHWTGHNRFTLIQRLPDPRSGSATALGDLHYLMVSEGDGTEYVLRYTVAEMHEYFRPHEAAELAKGAALMRGTCRFVDMVAAARTVR